MEIYAIARINKECRICIQTCN